MIDKINPLVTIGLTTYNRPDFLIEAVNSVLNQKYKNFKLIIGNDYPESKVTFADLGIDEDPRVKIINYKENSGGEINNLNYLLSQANSEWFTWLADDDVLHSSFLDSMIQTLKNSDDNLIGVYGTYVSGLSPSDEFFNKDITKNFMNLNSVDFISKYLSKDFNLVGCYGLMRTDKLNKIGGFPSLGPSEGSYCDTIIPILLSEYGYINVINAPLIYLRTHDKSYSSNIASLSHYTSAESDFLEKISTVCDNVSSKSFKNKCIYLMVHWFTANEFSVLYRGTQELKTYQKFYLVINLIIYQIKFNYPRIKIRYWLHHTLHIFKNIFSLFLQLIKSLNTYK